MFKNGDVIYCIEDDYMKNECGILKDTPYIVNNNKHSVVTIVKLLGKDNDFYYSGYFISEQEYQRNKRLEKILKIKCAIKNT